MNNKVYLIELNQPIGTFYIGKMFSNMLIEISKVEPREFNKGIQRQLSYERVNNISKFCDDPDATFPTPIIISIDSSDVNIKKYMDNGETKILEMDFIRTFKVAEILDGQHRIEGIKKDGKINIELPIVVMFDLTEEEKAYVFSTINSNQTKVDKSLIYDLFELSKSRSPYKTCHEIARTLNSTKGSPFFGKLKMLGRKTEESEQLSQGTFVSYLAKLISDNPQRDMIDYKKGKKPNENKNYILREYFLGDRDDIILKLLKDFFLAVSEVFPKEWNSNNYILAKTAGYGAMLMVFESAYKYGISHEDISKEMFKEILRKGKNSLEEDGKQLTSIDFPSNAQTQAKLSKYFNIK